MNKTKYLFGVFLVILLIIIFSFIDEIFRKDPEDVVQEKTIENVSIDKEQEEIQEQEEQFEGELLTPKEDPEDITSEGNEEEGMSEWDYYHRTFDVVDLSENLEKSIDSNVSGLKDTIENYVLQIGTIGEFTEAVVISSDTDSWLNMMEIQLQLNDEKKTVITITYNYDTKIFKVINSD